MKRKVIGLLVIATLAVGTRASAHHSFAATYDENKKVTIEGTLVQFLWRNPHSFVHLVVKDPATAKKSGEEQQRWAAEWGSGGQLGNQGVARDTLKVGDHLIITGDPSRTPGDYRVRVRTIYRPKDEWRWGGEFD
jgi:hypothetical protein